jgi:hypothetical protein
VEEPNFIFFSSMSQKSLWQCAVLVLSHFTVEDEMSRIFLKLRHKPVTWHVKILVSCNHVLSDRE